MYAQCLGAEFFLRPYSATSHVPGRKSIKKLRDRGNDNVLRDQGSHMVHGEVMINKGNPKNLSVKPVPVTLLAS
jgi:hypothetical protein